MTPDFNEAKVFYSVMGTDDEKIRTQAALDRAKSYLRSELRRLENLKNAPHLFFVLDNSAEEAQKVLDVLSQLEKERSPSPIIIEFMNPFLNNQPTSSPSSALLEF
jgi:ribosome-binding factor A